MDSPQTNMTNVGLMIIRANNLAASCLEEGRCEEAIQMFTESLAVSKTFLDEAGQCASCSTCCPSPPSSGPHQSETNSTTLSLDECISNPSVMYEQQQTGSDKLKTATAANAATSSAASFVYLNPLYLPAHIALNCSCRSNGIVLAIVTIFNLALSHHVYATQLPSCQADVAMEILEKSRRLYELAFQLYSEDRDDGITVSGGLLFLLATVNNLGMIHQQLGRSEPAHRCFQHVLSTMVFLIDQQRLQPNPAEFKGITKYLWQRFLDNTHHLVKHTCTAAAA